MTKPLKKIATLRQGYGKSAKKTITKGKYFFTMYPNTLKHKGLSLLDKTLFFFINNFNKDENEFFMSNNKIGQVLGYQGDTISKSITKLKRKELIKETKFDGRKRYLEVNIIIEEKIAPVISDDYDDDDDML